MKKARMRKDERIPIRISRTEKCALEKFALERDVAVSQIIRQAIRRELSIRDENPR
jgi:hypothetical protein